MTAVEDAARVLYADMNLTRAAVYTPPVGETVACRVMPDTGSDGVRAGGLPVRSGRGRAWRVLASVVTPVEGGRFTIDGEIHTVRGAPTLTGPHRIAWRCATTLEAS